jgi:F-type H+-transporting ATPase subunit a
VPETQRDDSHEGQDLGPGIDPVAGFEGAAGAGAGHSEDHGHGHAFDIGAAILHHNMPYPAWEIFSGKPIITFNLAEYAAIKYYKLSKYEAFAEADPAPYLEWAEGVAARPDFRFDHTQLEAEGLAKAMVVAEQKSLVTLPQSLGFLNQQTFFGTIALLLLFLVLGVFAKRRPDQLKPAGRVQHFFESIVIYLRDEVVRPSMHHGADRWLPFLGTMFFMILAVNLFGLIPGTGTMSGNIGVTAAWAAIVLLLMLGCGMKEQGLKYWINIVPIHFTWALSPVWFLLLVIELMGLIIKPAALAIRLFANMFAGHTVLLVFLSLGYIVLSKNADSAGLAMGLKGFGWILALAFYAMEVLVAFIQAYVFTLLAALFIGMSIHPEH